MWPLQGSEGLGIHLWKGCWDYGSLKKRGHGAGQARVRGGDKVGGRVGKQRWALPVVRKAQLSTALAVALRPLSYAYLPGSCR